MKVLVQSFSFRRTGYPKDEVGKGGGFVFDCRAIDVFDDPDRGERRAPFPFMHLTGKDSPVIDALDKNPRAQIFFNSVWTLVELNIERCIELGYEHVTVNFGCVGGQHRSVYMAERLTRRIGLFFPRDKVVVELKHLERAHWPGVV